MSWARLRDHARFRLGSALDLAETWAHAVPPRSLAWPRATASDALLCGAIARGARFLVEAQRPDGTLRGFQLVPGASVQWLTAHVALVCEDVPELNDLRAAAARHLLAVGPEDGGWGYNRRVAPDHDSTAQALIVIAAAGLEAPPFLHAWMARGQLVTGAYPTYPQARQGPAHGWQAPHPDTTQMAALYHDRCGDRSLARRCDRYLADVTGAGVPRSYWWPGPGYGLWLQGRRGRAMPATELVRRELDRQHAAPWSAFALSASVRAGLSTEVDAAVRRVVSQQLDDGSWPCAPCLRVTARSVPEARADALGPVVADRRRVFSTAHAVAALHEVRAARAARAVHMSHWRTSADRRRIPARSHQPRTSTAGSPDTGGTG